MISRIVHFIRSGIWEIQLNGLPAVQRFLVRYLRVTLLAVSGFYRDGCTLRASALTYYSLLSVVPFLAMAFGIAKGFGLEKYIEDEIMNLARRGQWEVDVTSRIVEFSHSLLENAKGGVIAGIGVVFLFWAILSILGQIEESFNTIWQVRRPRTLIRKFTDYVTLVVSAPILFIISSSMTVLIASRVEMVVQKMAFLGMVGSGILFLLRLLPYVSIWVLLTMHYIVMPNARVPIRSGLLAGVVTGTLYQIVQWFYIKFQIGVASYGAIYGSFAALPLFLVWLQLSWMIVLFGAEISYANGHFETYGFHPDLSKMSLHARKVFALRIYSLLIKRFSKAESPLSATQISQALKLPVRLVRELLGELSDAGLVVETAGERNHERTFQPGRSIEAITVKDALDAYEQGKRTPIPFPRSDDEKEISDVLRRLSDLVEKAPENVLLKGI